MTDPELIAMQTACSNRWSFWRRCWGWRKQVSELASAYSRMPESQKQAEVRFNELWLKITCLENALETAEMEAAKEKRSLQSEVLHLGERLKRAKSTSAALLQEEIQALRDKLHLAELATEAQRSLLKEEQEKHGTARKGIETLMRVVHRMQRTGTPAEASSLLSVLRGGIKS
jgi:predicted  nucleic acid-binding Zn-ribbon protein